MLLPVGVATVSICWLQCNRRPSIEWHEERYPTTSSGTWIARPNFAFAEDFISYTAQWVALIADWRDGVYDKARPVDFSPLTGLMAAIDWSLKRGQRVQQVGIRRRSLALCERISWMCITMLGMRRSSSE